ncbi:MAG TPA: hypothetical protein ENN81_07260 [Phycisphaerales bacterium]|nr:hypothetical protein [Phycisphaerales bacterium]
MPRTIVPGFMVVLTGTLLCAEAPRAVVTFECVGLYWRAEGGSDEDTCSVRYRRAGSDDWRQAMPLWFDSRTMSPVGYSGRGETESRPWEHGGEYRGSIVHLEAGTRYEAALRLSSGPQTVIAFQTWSEDFPVARRVEVSDSTQTLVIREGGDKDGYVVYGPPAGRDAATIDVANEHPHCVEVRASYVIIRGLTLKGAQQHGIRLMSGCHDIVIEQCDISGWGRVLEDGWGRNLDSAVYSNANDLERVIIQRNRIHHPRGDSNNWREERPGPGKREPFHPEGPQAVYFSNSAGNHVIRYNSVYSDEDHQYNDIFGAGSNFSVRGFPNCDSDIYGNYLSHCWDDTIESEGANRNVRIWGNYSTDCYIAIASAGTSVGPLYVWRNVSGRMRVAAGDWGGGFFKTSDIMGGGRIYVFHNTVLQPPVEAADRRVNGGARVGIGWGGPVANTVSRNNIWNAREAPFWDKKADPSNDYDYDLYRGALPRGRTHQANGIAGEPTYDPANGDGAFALAKGSPGYDAGLRIPNFNDNFTGAAPDMGAHEAGNAPMQFGIDAYRKQRD